MKTYRSKGKSKQVIALMLVLFLSLGQMAIVLANAGDVIDPTLPAPEIDNIGQDQTQVGGVVDIIDPNGTGILGISGTGILDMNGTGVLDPNATVQEDGSQTQFGGAAAMSQPVGALGAPVPGTPPGVSVTLDITTDEDPGQPVTGGYKHKQKINIAGVIQNSEVDIGGGDMKPALRNGMSLTFHFPSYVVIPTIGPGSPLDKWLNELITAGLLHPTSGIQSGTNQLTLFFTDKAFVIMEFSIDLEVDVTKYTGENDKKIELEFSNGSTSWWWEGGGIGIDPGVPTQHGIQKMPFGNNFEYLGNGIYRIIDSSKPVEYRIGVNIPAMDVGDYFEITDTTASYMKLCTPDGTYVTPGNVSGAFVFDTPFPVTPSITLTQGADSNKFTLRVDGPMSGGIFVFRYYMKLDSASQAAAVNNRINLTWYKQGEPYEDYDEVVVLNASSSALVASKLINTGTQKVTEYALTEHTVGDIQDVVFEIVMQQIMDTANSLPASQYAVDTLRDYFTFRSLGTPYGGPNGEAPFELRVNPARTEISVNKRELGKLKHGTYYLPFTVGVEVQKLTPGARGDNTIFGQTVFVYRNAQLRLKKIWEDGNNPNRGGVISFYLKDANNNVVAQAVNVPVAATGDTEQVLFINYLNGNLKNGTNTYYLSETLDGSSDYGTVAPIPVVITKDTSAGTVTFGDSGSASLTVDSTYPGIARAEFTNKPDDFKGSILFTKNSTPAKAINGGEFELRYMQDRYGAAIPAANQLVSLVDVGGYYVPAAGIVGGAPPVTKFGVVNNKIEIKDLDYGTYRLTEVKAPDGFLIGAASFIEFTIAKGTKHITNLQMTNTFFNTGSIKVRKLDQNDVGINGVTFTLFKKEGTNPNYTAVANGVKTTARNGSADGYVEFTGLEKGEYRIDETVPDGMQGAGTIHAVYFVIDENGATMVTAVVDANGSIVNGIDLTGKAIDLTWHNNKLYASIEILKIDETSGTSTPLSGATFTLQKADASGAPVGAVLDTKTTAADGKVTFTGLEYGSYVVTETVIPAGYEARTTGTGLRQSFSLTGDTVKAPTFTVSYTWGNPQKRGSIEIKKTAEGNSGNNIDLAGAKFRLYTYNGTGAPPDVVGDVDVDPVGAVVTTDASGIARFTGLLKGTYYVREIETPYGYKMEDTTYKKVVVGEGANADYQKITLNYHNPREKRDVKVIKKDENNANLTGAVFYLTGNDFSNNAYTSADVTTNAQGEAVFTGVPYGTYTIIERTPPAGYAAITNILNVVVNNTSTAQTLTYERADAPLELIVFKYDADNNKAPLAKADFIIRKGASGNEYIQAEKTATPDVYKYKGLVSEANATHFITPASGEFTITHLPAALYHIIEKDAPDGFNLLTAPVAATINTTTTILRSEIANGNIKGNLQIVKTDTFGKLLPGMKFRITGPNGYDQTFTTNNLGQINVTGLVYGDYLINEIDTPPEYAAIVNHPFTIAQQGVTITVNLVNEPETGRVTINKIDNGGKPLGNAVFNMRPVGNDGNVITTGVSYTAISNGQGVAEFKDIPYGYYAIMEQLAPNGYLKDDVLRYVSIGGAPRPAGLTDADVAGREFVSGDTITWTNDSIAGSLTINKTDGTNARAGATFKLYFRDTSLGRRGVTLTDTEASLGAGTYTFDSFSSESNATEFGTNVMGVAIVSGLPYGVYELLEETAPAGLVKDTSTHVIYVTDIIKNPTQTIVNPPVKGRLEVEKVDATDGTGLLGAVVRLYSYDNSLDPQHYQNAALLGEVTTNYAGKGSIENVPMGEYVAIEERAPANYTLGSDADRVKRFTLSENTPSQTIQLQFRNSKISYTLRIMKVDKDDNTVKLAGAKFKVVHKDTGWGPDVDKLVTDANGEILITGLAAGVYTIQEIEAPKGYAMDTRVQTIEFGKGAEDANGRITVTAENEKVVGSVELSKIDQDDKPLDGAEFELLDAAGKALKLTRTAPNTYTLDDAGSITSFEAGKITINGLPMGKYEFKELAAPKNYAILATNYAFEVTASNFKSVIKVIAQNVQQKATLSLRKVDNENRNLSLPDAEFTLYSSTDNGVTYPTEVTKKVSNAAGYVIFTDLTQGYYQVVETKAPAGYQPWINPIKFQVDDQGKIRIGGNEVNKDGEVYTVTVVNHKLSQQLRLKKVDSTTGAVLAGAVFSLTGNGVSHSLTTGADGLTPYVTLTPGTYTLTETHAPDGYQLLSGSNTVVVSDSGITVDGVALTGSSPFTYTVNNSRVINRLMLYKTDSRTANPLSGASFSLTPRNGGNSITLTTDGNGQSNIVTVTAGTYDIVETAAPGGYNRPLSGWTVQISDAGSASVSGTGISTWVSGGVIVINITNTTTTTSTPTPIPGGGGGGGSTTSTTSGGSTSTRTASPGEAIPLGPGLPQTGELTNTQALILGASLLLLSLIALLLFVALGGKPENTEILPALI